VAFLFYLFVVGGVFTKWCFDDIKVEEYVN